MRLFVAPWPPPTIVDSARALTRDLVASIPRRSARFVRPEQWHLTLRFLGEVPDGPEHLDALASALREAVVSSAPFRLHVEGLGCFPASGQPRVLWLGVGGDLGPLRQLQLRVTQATEPFCLSQTPAPFHPHLTIARVPLASPPRPPRIDRTGFDAVTGEGLGERIGSRPSPGFFPLRELLVRFPLPKSETWVVDRIDLIRSDLSAHGSAYTTLLSHPFLGLGG